MDNVTYFLNEYTILLRVVVVLFTRGVSEDLRLKKCKVEVAVTDSNCVTDINSNLGLL